MDIQSQRGNWIRGEMEVKGNTFSFSAKVFPNPDGGYGITDTNGDGHISKLEVVHLDGFEGDEKVLMYDRGWVFNYLPKTSKKIVGKIEDHVKNEFEL